MVPAKICECENISHGELGSVNDEEALGRVVRNPMHLNAQGQIKIGLFPARHIQETGVSLLRMDLTSESEALDLAELIASTNSNTLEGLATATAKSIRDIQINDTQALCIVDTPLEAIGDLPAIPHHADALQSAEHNPEDIEELRNRLLVVFRTSNIIKKQ